MDSSVFLLNGWGDSVLQEIIMCSDVMDAIMNREEIDEGGVLYAHQGLPIKILRC